MLKHENYSKLIEDDEEFEVQERWMEECQEIFMETEMQTKINQENLVTKGKGPLEIGFTDKNTSSTDPEPCVSGISSMQSSENKDTLDDGFVNLTEIIDDVQNTNVRFCDLAHLVKRCYNTLKEVGVPYDMDNSHMLSIIEQKKVRGW